MQGQACRQELRKARWEKLKGSKPESHMCSWRNGSQKDCLVSLSLSCVLAQKHTFHFKTPSYLGSTCCCEQLKSQYNRALPDAWNKEHTENYVQLVNRSEKAINIHWCHRDCRIMPCTLRAFIPIPMRVLLESLLAESIAHTCRQSGRPESLSDCSCNCIICEEEEEGNRTFYPDHYTGSGSDLGIKAPHCSISTLKLS